MSFLDLAYRAGWDCLQASRWHASEPQALVVVTQSQPRRIPSIACELHQRLGMGQDVPAFDVGLACSGYPYGLWIATSLRLPKVLVVVGDTISRFLDPSDTATYPIFGDAVSATAIEQREGPGGITFIGGTEGRGAEALQCPHGGDGYLRMKGLDVFDFALSTVPGLVKETTMNGHVDWFLMHQANASMLGRIAAKAGIPMAKMPLNLDRFGNTSSASIPLLMVDSECTEALRERNNRVAMFGFGAGFSWGSALLDVGPIPLSLSEV